MDLGANWANTLRLHHKLKGHVRQKILHPSDPRAFNNCSYEWEVYAFEASPVMHPFIESFVKHLNGDGPRPPIVVPPVGGSIQMLAYAKHFGCPSRHNRTDYPRMYRCMNHIFREPYSTLSVDPSLNDSTLLQRRLDEAAVPNRGTATRYTFVPAAVGGVAGELYVEWPAGVLLYVDAPGNPKERIPRPAGVPVHMSVGVINWAQWLKQHFQHDDIVLVKVRVAHQQGRQQHEHDLVSRSRRWTSRGLSTRSCHACSVTTQST